MVGEVEMSPASRARELAPWIEGGVLALCVLAILALGGDAVRASYHGYLHVAIGEAVVRDGLRPENPYHAGVPLRYYTLYPWLGVMIGRIGFGPLWGFALLNVLSALLLAPALDAFGRELGLSFAARRAAFVAAVLGFNGLGWIGVAIHGTSAFGEPPVYALMPLTFARESLGWDARLQAFLPKFLNVSSYAIALPFALWAMGFAVRDERRSARAVATVAPLALSIALNPIVGGFAAVVIAAWVAPTLARGSWRERAAWPIAGCAAALLALPFLLSALSPAEHGPTLTGNPKLGGNPASNVLGPLLLIIAPAAIGFATLERSVRWRLALALALAALLVVVGEMPQGNEYKMERLLALLVALPCGAWAARAVQAGGARRSVAWMLAIACVPTTLLVPWAYLAYGARAAPLPLENDGGRLTVRRNASGRTLDPAILEAEMHADPRAVLVTPLDLPGSRVSQSLVQGNALAPALHHALFADLPQIHNEHIEDLARRLDLLAALDTSLARIRAIVAGRELLVIARESPAPVSQDASPAALASAGGRVLARGGEYALWSLPPLASTGER
jgi:hypothetical protein